MKTTCSVNVQSVEPTFPALYVSRGMGGVASKGTIALFTAPTKSIVLVPTAAGPTTLKVGEPARVYTDAYCTDGTWERLPVGSTVTLTQE